MINYRFQNLHGSLPSHVALAESDRVCGSDGEDISSRERGCCQACSVRSLLWRSFCVPDCCPEPVDRRFLVGECLLTRGLAWLFEGAFEVYVSPLVRACFHHIGLRGEIIVQYHPRRFRETRYNLCVLLLFYGSIKFIREKPPKLHRVLDR